MLVFIYVLPYEKSKEGEVCEPSKKEWIFENRDFFFHSLQAFLKQAIKLLPSLLCPSVCVNPSVWKLSTVRIFMIILYLCISGKMCRENLFH